MKLERPVACNDTQETDAVASENKVTFISILSGRIR
jgi:hypothetical protein